MNRIIKRWWTTVSGKLVADVEQRDDVTARELCRMMKRCPVCSGDFDDHAYAHFAVTVLNDQQRKRAMTFIDACEEHRWEEARRFQEFEKDRDALVAYAFRCHTGRLTLLLERSPFEVYEPDRLIACNVLDETSGERLERLVSRSDWRRLHGFGAVGDLPQYC
ncbi:MAG: hypothetical protein SF339_14270 [Blastocatellia bacterium]|nr:hypothetical protein [Blastocatellia bacterium]